MTLSELVKQAREVVGPKSSIAVDVTVWDRPSAPEGMVHEVTWNIWDGAHHNKGRTPEEALQVLRGKHGQSLEQASAAVDVGVAS